MRYVGIFILFATVLFWPAYAFGSGRINISYIQGRIVAICDVTIGEEVIPASVIIDLGLRHTAGLQYSLADDYALESGSEIKFDFYDGNVIKVTDYGFADIYSYQTVVNYFATELDNRVLVGVIGLPALCQEPGNVVLDIEQGYLAYGQQGEISSHTAVIKIHQPGPQYYIDIEPYPGYVLKGFLTTSVYDTQIDSVCAAIAGNSGGGFDHCYFGSVDIMPYTAVRPVENFTLNETRRYDAVVGNGFWQNFIATFDYKNGLIYLQEKPGMKPDLSEQEYFAAVIEREYDKVLKYIENKPKSRLVGEATILLLQEASGDEFFNDEVVEKLFRIIIKMDKSGQSADKVMYYLEKLADHDDFTEVTEKIFQMMVTEVYSTSDLIIERYRLEARIGALFLDKGQNQKAYEHLLAAMFNQPFNSEINFQMGRYYLAQGFEIRAWSRFLRAVISTNGHVKARTELEKLYNSASFRDKFSMADARDVYDSFTTASAYRKLDDANNVMNPPDYRQLIDAKWTPKDRLLLEFFVYTDSEELSELITAVEAIERYYPDAGLCSICYQLSMPGISSFATPYGQNLATEYNATARPAIYVNGKAYGLNQLELDSASLIIDNLSLVKASRVVPFSEVLVSRSENNSYSISVTPPVTEYVRYEIILLEDNVLCQRADELVFMNNICRGELGRGERIGSIRLDFSLAEFQGKYNSWIDGQYAGPVDAFLWRSAIIEAGQCSILVKYYDDAGVVCGYSQGAIPARGGSDE